MYQKIKAVTKTNGTLIKYTYGASGNRISKIVNTGDSTYYVRDASGNVMSVYHKKGALALTQTELHLYGSSRLGVYNVNVDVQNCLQTTNLITIFTRGNKFFELCNHLGNVLVTVSDKRLQVTLDGIGTFYYLPEVVTAQDYYPFGSLMPGRRYSVARANYRYGFNGKENDNEVKGEGNQQDYGMRIYDPRLGRFLSVDPLTREYPELTPYQFASNMPINSIDLDGAEQMEQIRFWITDPKKIIKTTGYREVTLGVAIAVDAALTKGWFSRLIIGSRLAGTQHHNKAITPKQEQERQHERTNALIDAGMGFGVSKILGNIIRLGLTGKDDLKYLFRGTSENFQGSAALQKIGVTAISSDPAVATIFAITSKNSGQGILQIALPKELQGVTASSNVLASLEKEVALSLKPVEFTARVSTTITADEARGILSGMGIKLPAKISLTEQSNIIRETPKLNVSQIDEFYKKALELKGN